MTLFELIQTGAEQFTQAGISFGHGTTNAHDEAAWLALWRLGLPLDGDDSRLHRPLTPAESAQVATIFEARIATRKPAAYLTREAWLQGFSFYIDERSIVPRSFIAELLVDGSIDYWLSENTQRVLDVCTGNGSLGLIATQVYPEITVVGADISPDALAVAAINIERYNMASRMALVQSDGLAGVEGQFDLILCNPPYVNAQSMNQLPAEYRAEPELALAGGEDGMDFIRNLLRDVPARMNDNAVLVLEIGNERPYFEAAFPDLSAHAVWLETSAGSDQVVLLEKTAIQTAIQAVIQSHNL